MAHVKHLFLAPILARRAGKRYNQPHTTTKILATCLLLAGAAAGQQPEIVSQLPGGLKGEILMLAKSNRGELTVAVKVTNEAGSRGDAHILLFGEPSAFDDVGNRYDPHSLTGVAYCPGPQSNPPSFRLCVGLPRVDESHFFPLQGYTDIEPGKSVIVSLATAG